MRAMGKHDKSLRYGPRAAYVRTSGGWAGPGCVRMYSGRTQAKCHSHEQLSNPEFCSVWGVTHRPIPAPLFISIYKRELGSVRGHRSVLRVLKFDLVLHWEMKMFYTLNTWVWGEGSKKHEDSTWSPRVHAKIATTDDIHTCNHTYKDMALCSN